MPPRRGPPREPSAPERISTELETAGFFAIRSTLLEERKV